MRIIQAMGARGFGGAEAFFVRLAKAFHDRGLEQKLLIANNHSRMKKFDREGIPYKVLKFSGSLDFATKRLFQNEIQTFQPDIVLTWMSRASHFCPLSTNIPFVSIARLGGYYNLKYYQNCQHLIGNTQDIVDYLSKEGWPKDHAHYIPNFVKKKNASPIDKNVFDTPQDAPLILALGRLHENKAFDTLIKSLVHTPKAYLWIGGEGPEHTALAELATELGVQDRIRFLGWQEKVGPLFATADIFVCPSRHEPLGNVVIEAWANEIPVIAAESAGPKSLIKNKKSGMLVPIDDPKVMGTTIQSLLESPALQKPLIQEGVKAYEKNFTEDIIVAKYL
ncbi:MAG: glycosyltransferase, partial [Alphaproteobacteria bacterium]|nr:glycosyltransferase [Alphaproteobacteria bacterium]